MLFEPDRHEALCDTAWDAAAARDTIRAIVSDIEHNRRVEGHWPLHPLDDEGDAPRSGFKSLYLGSAGVLWALWLLQREGAVKPQSDPPAGIPIRVQTSLQADLRAGLEQADAAYQADPDSGVVVPSYFLGEVGILLLLWCLSGSSVVADRLYASVKSNIRNPTHEMLWGASGTMLAAWHLWQASADERWRDLFLDNVEQVWQTWLFDAKAQCHLWTQDMYGKVVQYIGAGHGFAGNVHPLLKGAALLDAQRRETLYDRCLATVRAMAKFEGDAVNWPAGTYTPRAGSSGMLMQWCHGAPGMVTALADFPAQRSAEMEALLSAAGRAIWQAGPLSKGYGLCHGTAGNGYAFLKLYRRSGDTLWLDRARAFAVHAMAQRQQMRQQHGQGRYTLWTGDAGLAIYLRHCLDGTAALPALDMLH